MNGHVMLAEVLGELLLRTMLSGYSGIPSQWTWLHEVLWWSVPMASRFLVPLSPSHSQLPSQELFRYPIEKLTERAKTKWGYPESCSMLFRMENKGAVEKPFGLCLFLEVCSTLIIFKRPNSLQRRKSTKNSSSALIGVSNSPSECSTPWSI